MKVTIVNIDDIMRAEKRKLYEKGERIDNLVMEWGQEAWDILRMFTKADTYFGMRHVLNKDLEDYVLRQDNSN